MNTPIEFISSRDQTWCDPVTVARVKEIKTFPAGHDRFGNLRGGYIRISGHLEPSQRTSSEWLTNETGECTFSNDQYEWFDDGYTDEFDRSMDEAFFFLMAFQKPETEEDGRCVEVGKVWGLIVERAGADGTKYHRIGAFSHLWGPGRTKEHTAVTPEDYPEFIDFNPRCFKRHTITIV